MLGEGRERCADLLGKVAGGEGLLVAAVKEERDEEEQPRVPVERGQVPRLLPHQLHVEYHLPVLLLPQVVFALSLRFRFRFRIVVSVVFALLLFNDHGSGEGLLIAEEEHDQHAGGAHGGEEVEEHLDGLGLAAQAVAEDEDQARHHIAHHAGPLQRVRVVFNTQGVARVCRVLCCVRCGRTVRAAAKMPLKRPISDLGGLPLASA